MKILFVAANLPYPTVRGDGQRSNLLYRALARVGHVDLFGIAGRIPAPEDMQRVLRAEYHMVDYAERTMSGERFPWKGLRRLNPRWIDRLAHNFSSRALEYAPDPAVAPRLKEVVAHHQYDLVVGRYLLPTALSGALELNLPTIIDIDDVDTSIYETRLAAPGTKWWERVVIKHHLRQLKHIFPARIQAADHVWVANPQDLDLVEHRSRSVLPNIPFGEMPGEGEDHDAVSQNDKSPCVLMVGSLTHAVNRRAVDRFLKAVWPTVADAVPEARFRIVGSGMTPEQQARWRAHRQVDAVGFAADLAQEYARCAFAVCPIFEGGGTKIKILEALSHGRTIVVARHSIRGYERELIDGDALLIADNEQQFAQACIRLLRDDNLRKRLAVTGKTIVKERYSFERFAEVVRYTVEKLVGSV